MQLHEEEEEEEEEAQTAADFDIPNDRLFSTTATNEVFEDIATVFLDLYPLPP
jgi:hypothetical protein